MNKVINKKTLNFIKKIFSSYYFWIGLLVLFYFSPMLIFPEFSYIDDGASLLTAKKIINSPISDWPDYLFESHIGRMRPMYYLYFVILYLIVGPSAFGFWLFRAIIFFLFLLGVYKLTIQNNNNKLSITHFILLFVFILLPEVIENTFRLGPAEIRQALFMIWFMVSLKSFWKKIPTNKEILIVNLFFVSAILTKETAILLYPLFLIYFVNKLYFERKFFHSKKIWFLFVSISLQMTMFLLILPKQQGYTSSFQFSIKELWGKILISRLEMAHYYLLLSIAGILSLMRSFIAIKEREIKNFIYSFNWQVIYLFGIIFSLIFVFSWDHHLIRYYYLTIVFIWLYLLTEIGLFKKSLSKLKLFSNETKIILLLVCLGLFLEIYSSIFQKKGLEWNKVIDKSYQSAYGWFRSYQVSGPLIRYLYNNLPIGTQIYTTATDYEQIIDMGYFASQFGDRNIIIYSSNISAEKNHPETQRYAEDLLTLYDGASKPKLLITDLFFIKEKNDKNQFIILRPKKNILFHEESRFWRIKIDF